MKMVQLGGGVAFSFPKDFHTSTGNVSLVFCPCWPIKQSIARLTRIPPSHRVVVSECDAVFGRM